MQYVIGITAISPMRSEASHKSEMVSQLLFGEWGTVIEKNEDFVKICSTEDGYEGWVQTNQLQYMEEEPWHKSAALLGYTKDTALISIDQQPATIYAGTPVWNHSHWGDIHVDYRRVPVVKDLDFQEANLKMIAQPYYNAPYLWGGKSTAGTDCSGFVQQVYKVFGVDLPRDAYLQAEMGESIGFLEEAKLGDLAYFDNAAGKITHVGIILNQHKVLHGSGRVRLDALDAQGIVQEKSRLRTHHLRIIKRII